MAPLKLLIIGGTAFLGRAIVDAAINNGHQITIFHRGKSNPGLFPGINTIIGDRNTDLDKLDNQEWDAVIDTCGYLPKIVRSSVEKLQDKVKSYVFISTLSVYADPSQTNLDESAPVGSLEDPSIEEINGETYGPLKAYCEKEVLDVFGTKSLIIRPGLIVGPYDYSDRFNYWVHRVTLPGPILAPGRPESAIQCIDVRDLASWTVSLIEDKQSGIFNADSQPNQITMGVYLKSCQQLTDNKNPVIWVDETFLLENGVEPWIELPLWIPESDPTTKGFFQFNVSKAFRYGLKTRPLSETIKDTHLWLQSKDPDHTWRAGMKPERESELIKLWNKNNDA